MAAAVAHGGNGAVVLCDCPELCGNASGREEREREREREREQPEMRETSERFLGCLTGRKKESRVFLSLKLCG